MSVGQIHENCYVKELTRVPPGVGTGNGLFIVSMYSLPLPRSTVSVSVGQIHENWSVKGLTRVPTGVGIAYELFIVSMYSLP